jgi:hypothetical protein
VGLDTPAENGAVRACIGCLLNFTTGNLTRTTPKNWVFGPGGTIALTGSFDLDGDGVNDVPPGSTLLTGSFTEDTIVVKGSSTFKIAIGGFQDTKVAALATFFGLPSAGAYFGGLNIGFYTPASPPQTFASTLVVGSNLVNCVAIPGTGGAP